jgi:cation diffusion facilitator CzcD-associated flavoprotein CzcO
VERQPESLIIGAGPAGLAVAACLRKCSASFELVEQADTLGASWRRHYDRLHLHTDAAHSALPYFGFPEGTPRYPSRDQVIAYLEQYARHFEIAPRVNECVQRVRYRDQTWVTTTPTCVYHSKQVIVATGYNAVPHLPQWPGLDQYRGRILHSSEYRNGELFRGQDVLVVGLGNSGGEIAIDLCEQGARSVAIAVRDGVNIVPREIFGLPILAVAIALSRFPTRLADWLAAPIVRLSLGDISRLGFRKLPIGPITQIVTTSRVPLVDIGTLKLVREGRIEILGGVRSFGGETDGTRKEEVRFDDGSSRRFDAIVLATGFRPGLERFLEMPAPGKLGLYFCGFRVSPTGMFRDIGFEARAIAREIAGARRAG